MPIDPRADRMRKRRTVAAPPAAGDSFWSSVKLLMHMDGSNNSTTFVDSSTNNATCTAFGNAKISTATVKYGTGACWINAGSSDRVTVADKVAGQFSLAGDFTVEAWVYPTAAASYRTIITRYNAANNAWLMRFDGNASAITSLAWYAGQATGAYYNFAATIALNQWHHVAVCRAGSSVRGFLNGTQIGTTQTNSGTMTGGSAGNLVGASDQSGFQFPFAGYIDDLRITLAARYQSSFTPSTVAFPDS